MDRTIAISFRDRAWPRAVRAGLLALGIRVEDVPFGTARPSAPDLLIFEYRPDAAASILAWIHEWRITAGDFPVIAVAFESDEEHVIRALRGGVTDYLRTPSSAAEIVDAAAALLHLQAAPEQPVLVGDSAAMRQTRALIRQAAASEANVLITGETGTGKEMVAEAIHRGSRRAAQPVICINCAAIPDELFESELFGYEKGAFTGAHAAREGKVKLAEGGTLFLDEIGELSHFAQAKILRVIDTREVWPLGRRRPIRVNTRIVAATNRDLEGMACKNAFRLDLFYRLKVAHIHVASLRERAEDVPALLGHFIRVLSVRAPGDLEEFDASAVQVLQRYSWPGNVRELRNLVESVLVKQPPRNIGMNDLPAHLCTTAQAEASEEDLARLMDALASTNWNVSQAAKKLNWSRMTIYRKMARYHVLKSRPAFAGT